MADADDLPPTMTMPTGTSASTGDRYIGQTLDGRYQVLQLIGRGGMGSVYLARHVVIGRSLAIKIFDSRRIEEREGLKRVFREAQTAAAIGHPNIVEVVDVGTSELGDPYMVMEYLLGEDLKSFIERQGAVTVATTIAILEPILKALREAHRHHVVHRDLKPSNIFLNRRPGAPIMVKLIDFGVAKVLGPNQDGKITQTGTLLGTPSYMSPEQAVGIEELDARVDLYAVGVIFYELITGKLPFVGANYNELLYRIVRDVVPRPQSPVEILPPDVCDLIERATSKVASERFQSANEMLEAFHQLDAWTQHDAALAKLEDSVEVTVPGDGIPESTVDARAPSTSAKTKLSGLKDSQVVVRTDSPPPVTEGSSPDETNPRQRPRTGLAAALGMLGAAIVVAVLALTLSPERSESGAASATDPEATTRAEEGVQITIQGAPPKATVYYDRAPVAERQFRVRRSELVTPIRVELDGHRPFVTTVIPREDVTVRVRLERLPKPALNRGDASATTSATPPPDSRYPLPKPGLGKLGRDTYYTEEFE